MGLMSIVAIRLTDHYSVDRPCADIC